jgi:hypothetical protein
MHTIAHEKYASRSPNTDFPLPKFEKNFKSDVHGFKFFRQSDLEDTKKSVYVSHILAAKDLGVENPNVDSGSPNLIIGENAFVFDWLSNQITDYYHFLFEVIGSFQLIKKSFPNIKFYVVYSEKMLNLWDMKIADNRLIMETIDLYGADQVKLINMDKIKSVLFKRVLFCSTDAPSYFIDNFYNFKTYYVSIQALKKYHMAIAFCLKELFDLEKRPYRKIFLSRLSYNNKLRIKKDAFIKKYILNMPEDSFSKEELFYIKFNKINMEIDQDILMLNVNILRPPSLEDEIKIEQFFQSIGYEIAVLDNLTMSEQAKILSSATHVAGLSGTAMGNTVFCNKNTKVLVLNTTDAYNFPHAMQSFWNGNVSLEVPKLNFSLNRWFSGDEIISAVMKKKEML